MNTTESEVSPNQIAAFFDLDGTLLPAPSLEWRFIAYLLSQDEISADHMICWLGHWAKTFPRNPRAAANANKYYLAGLRESLVGDWADSVEPGSIAMLTGGVAGIVWHLAQQHRVFIVSGTLATLARVLATRISPDIKVIATDLEVSRGLWTGQLAGEHIHGKTKQRVIRDCEARLKLRLDLSYAYGNESADVPMLESVGYPQVVNPGARLRRIARKRSWPIRHWIAHNESALESAHSLTEREAR